MFDLFHLGQALVFDKLLGHVPDHRLFFRQILRCKNVFWGTLFDKKAAPFVNLDQFLCHSLSSCILSKIPAAPMPPPTHIVTIPYRAARRCISYSNVAVNLDPVQPSGCPKAMAPPLTFTFDGSRPNSRMTAIDWTAKASLSSIKSMSFRFKPACFSTFGMASMGPMPITSGRTPAVA